MKFLNGLKDFQSQKSLNAEARRRYDDYQMQLIHARIVRITNTAAVEGEETNVDGPSGQGPV